jgi:predicted RNA-binding Zn-ribbon protein involved in translation (DUF1610 family)
MFDFVKIKKLDVPDVSVLRRKLGVTISVSEDSAEIVNERKEIKVNDLYFGFYDKYASLKGSIHKYHNGGQHNYNDFYISDVLTVIKDLYIKYEINPEINRLNCLEFGVNISVPFNVDKFLYNLILHNGKHFTVRREKNMTFYEFIHTNHIIKFYNKGKQYRSKHDIRGEILRFEVKVMRMEYLHSKGVKIGFIKDLLNTTLYCKLGQILSDTYNEILIFDSSVRGETLKPKQREFYRVAENPKYWIELIGAYTDKKENPTEYRNKRTYYQRKVKEFRSIQSEHTQTGHIQLVGSLINQKWGELTRITPEIKASINEFLDTQKCSNLTDYSNVGECQKCSNLTPYIYSQFATLYVPEKPKRFCASCNKDITHQKDSSKFCSPKYVGEVEAHKCRNTDSNKRNNLKYKIQRIYSRGVLFEIEPFMIDFGNKSHSISI